MPLIVSDAMVLQSTNYLESSRIFRLATREAGVQSVLARGARTSKKRFGSALGLFAQGHAQIDMKPGRELHTLLSFDVVRVLPELATDMGRFTASHAFAECVVRLVHDEAAPAVYDGIVEGFDAIAAAVSGQSVAAALGAMWRLVSDVGFTPSLDACAECHVALDRMSDVMFSHRAGGALCARCGQQSAGGRKLPASARAMVNSWLDPMPIGGTLTLDENGVAEGSAGTRSTVEAPGISLSDGELKAHQRLLREFLAQHVSEQGGMKAYAVWENAEWVAAHR